MGSDMVYIGGAVAVGVGAVLIMDLWNLFLQRACKISSLNFCLVVRWLSHMPTGTFKHASIAAVRKMPVECAIGWTAHYLIGIAFAVMLVMMTSGSWLESPSLLPVLLVGLGTVLIPYFIVQPALGFGIAAAKTPNPAQARLKSLITHTVLGVGLYLSAVPVSYVMQ